MRLEVGVGFSESTKAKFHYDFNPKIHGADAIFLDVGKPFKPIENYVRADVQHLPFRKQVFEEIYAAHLIEHLDRPALFLKECRRVLESRGKIHIWCPNFLSWSAWADPTHKYSFSYHSLHRLLTNYGFASSVHAHGFFLSGIFNKLLAFLSNDLEALGTKL